MTYFRILLAHNKLDMIRNVEGKIIWGVVSVSAAFYEYSSFINNQRVSTLQGHPAKQRVATTSAWVFVIIYLRLDFVAHVTTVLLYISR